MATWKKWTSTVLVNGQPEPNVEVHVYEPGTTNEITVYEDEGVTPITQPILTDSQGRYAFFVDVDTYPEIRLYLEKDGVDFSEANEDLDGVPVPGAGAGAGTFLELTDTPSSYVGRGGDVVLVKTTEDGIETQPWPVTGSTLNFFLSDDAADIGSYYYMYPTESGDGYSELTSPSLSTGDDQLLWSFVTEAGEPGVEVLALGAYTATLFLKKTGNKDVRVYWKLFKRDTGGTETEILQSAVSDYLTTDNSQYLISAYLNEDQVLDPTDRLVLKLYANVSGTGTDVTVTLTMEGDYDSRLTINVLSSAFNLDRLSDVTITAPADNELLVYDSASAKWKNQTLPTHGNERHDPDFLAVDGSNAMEDVLQGSSNAPHRILQKLALNYDLSLGDNLVMPLLMSDIAYLEPKGGSVTASPMPTSGSLSNLFDGSLARADWSSPTGTITVEVTLQKTFTWGCTVYCIMQAGYRAKDVTIEYYDPVDAQWKTIVAVTDWKYAVVSGYVTAGSHGMSKLRFSFANFLTSQFRLIELGLVNVAGDLFGTYLFPRSGGVLYGDIDMNGNDIDNLNCINSSGSDLGVKTPSPGYDLDVTGDIHCTGKLTSDGGNDPPYVLYNYETRTSIVDRVKSEVLPDKLNGAVLFFNGDRGQLELFLPSKGEFRSLDGKVLEMVKPITQTFETEDRYYLDEETGEIKTYKVKRTRAKYRLKPNHELDPRTGKVKRKIIEKKEDPETGEEIEGIVGEEEVSPEEAIELVKVAKEDGR